MYYFIVNEHGGSGRTKRTWQKVQKLMDASGEQYKSFSTDSETAATEIARKLTENAAEDIRIVVVGGDGSINSVLCGIQDFSKVSFGLIPSGSGNDFARGMGIPHNTRKAVQQILSAGDGKLVDIGCVEKSGAALRFFGISAGIGMDAIVCKLASVSRLKAVLNHLGLGKFIYVILTVRTLFSMKKEKVSVQFDDNEAVNFDGLIFLATMNLRAEGGGVPMCPDAVPTDGKLSVCIASGISKLRAFLLFPKLIMGKHAGSKGFFLQDCTSVTIKTQNPMAFHTDGEYCGDVQAICIKCLKEKLRLLSC